VRPAPFFLPLSPCIFSAKEPCIGIFPEEGDHQ
jgi:hypothetical protein